MRFSLSWLSDYFCTTTPLPTLLEALGSLGHEVEAIIDYQKTLAGFIVAEIQEATPHPSADRLRVCKVWTGTETLQIVCGAPNARAGIKVVMAPVGVTIPTNHLEIKAATIRGVSSNGMLCSAQELGIGTDGGGIIELLSDSQPGQPAVEALRLKDPIIELSITPNRSDAIYLYGIARDLAAYGATTTSIGTLLPLPQPHFANTTPYTRDIAIDTPDACTRFTSRLVTGIRNCASPAWLQERLIAAGMTPISAAVDVTNYIAHITGQPLHAYDADRLTGGLTVRAAKADEPFVSLANKSYTLHPSILVIADEKGPQSIAGVIGGMESACTETTTNVLLEAAHFTPSTVITSSRSLHIQTEASYRFERQVNREATAHAMNWAAHLLQEIAGGTVSELTLLGNPTQEPQPITLPLALITRYTALSLPSSTCRTLLEALGCQVTETADALTVTPPAYRPDLSIPQDLIEEIARLHGYDHIPTQPLPPLTDFQHRFATHSQHLRFTARRHLATLGYCETVSWSFIPPAHASLFAPGKDLTGLTLLNPISAELTTMRPSLLPSLLELLYRNHCRGQSDLALTEIAPIYHGVTPSDQSYSIALILAGQAISRNWHEATRAVDFYDIKAHILSLLATYGISESQLSYTTDGLPSWYHPGKAATLLLNHTTPLASFGALHPAIAKHWNLDMPIMAAELHLDAIPAPTRTSHETVQFSKYPGVERDFAFILDKQIRAAEVLNLIHTLDSPLIQHAQIFDVYTGKNVPEGKRSLALMVRYQAPDRTLSEEDIQALDHTLIQRITQQLHGTLRGPHLDPLAQTS